MAHTDGNNLKHTSNFMTCCGDFTGGELLVQDPTGHEKISWKGKCLGGGIFA